MKRRHFLLFASGAFAIAIGGCSWFNGATMRSQSPEDAPPDKPHTRLVGDLAVPLENAMQPARVDAIGLVTGLHGSGSDPSPSFQRDALLEEMKARDVAKPNTVLASGNVSLVVIQGYLRPGIQKGDRFDIEVCVPSQSDTTSLRGGYLLETRLTETAVLDDQRRHHGNLLALAKGPVLVDPTADPKDRLMVCRGRILGGGVVLKSRPMGLVILPEHKGVANSSRVANAVNKRFHTLENGVQTSMAKAKTDEFIELSVHPRYKDNIARFIQVIRALPLAESDAERMARITALRSQLLDPVTSAEAALQLEAIGTEGEDALLAGIKSRDTEVRFYAAEALAYLDRREAAGPLGQIAREQPAFRVFALTALSAMQDFAAYDQLRDLLSLPSAETRYGAFRALWTINNKNPLVKGEMLADQFHYHLLDVAGPPMIHVTRNRLPEIVIFGLGQKFLTPLALNAGNDIMIRSAGGDEIAVSKYSVAEGDQKRTVSTQIDDVIRAVVELGGTYPDVVQALSEAKKCGALASRFEIDALPEAGRSYDRVAQDEQPSQGEEKSGLDQGKIKQQTRAIPASPSPELFAKKQDTSSMTEGKPTDPSDDKSADDDDSDEKSKPKKGFFDRILGR